MLKKSMLLWTAFSSVILLPLMSFAAQLPPIGDPVQIIPSSGSFLLPGSPVTVAGNNSGFMSAWVDQDDDILASFSKDNGKTWSSSPQVIGSDPQGGVNIAANSSGFVAICSVVPIGSSGGSVFATFYDTQSQTWTTPTQISPPFGMPGGAASRYVAICAINGGFMAAWFDFASESPWAVFSADGRNWNTAVEVNLGSFQEDSVRVAGNEQGFMVAWLDNMGNFFTSFSADQGASWSPPVLPFTDPQSNVSVGGINTGFLITWMDTDNNGQSSFSTDFGSTWSDPVSFAANVSGDGPDMPISGLNNNLVVTWIDQDGNGMVSLSQDQGASWSTPLLATAATGANSIRGSFVALSSTAAGTMFTWIDNDSEAESSFSTNPSHSDSSSTFYKQINLSRPKGHLFGP